MELAAHRVASASAEIWTLRQEGDCVLVIHCARQDGEPLAVKLFGTEAHLRAVCEAIGKAPVIDHVTLEVRR